MSSDIRVAYASLPSPPQGTHSNKLRGSALTQLVYAYIATVYSYLSPYHRQEGSTKTRNKSIWQPPTHVYCTRNQLEGWSSARALPCVSLLFSCSCCPPFRLALAHRIAYQNLKITRDLPFRGSGTNLCRALILRHSVLRDYLFIRTSRNESLGAGCRAPWHWHRHRHRHRAMNGTLEARMISFS